MKHFKLMIKAFLDKPFKSLLALLFFLLWFGSVNFYKIYFVGNNNFIQIEDGNITISRAFLIPAFIMIVISGLIIPVASLRESLKRNVHLLVPDIRKDKLQFYAVVILMLFIWAIFMIGVENLIFLFIFLMFCLWFISLMIVALFGLRFLYRSDKFNVLKFLFYFYPLFTVIIYKLRGYSGDTQLILYFLIVFYCLIIINQIINFYHNFVNYKEDYERNYHSGWTRLLSGDFIGHLEYKTKVRSVYRMIKKHQETRTQNTLSQLVQYILFRNNSNRVVIGDSLFAWAFYYSVILIMGLKYGMFLVFYMYIYSAFTSINTFRSKEIIEHIYITSKLNRKSFELTILRSYLIPFVKYSLFDGFIVMILYVVHKYFYEDLTITPIIFLYAISFTARITIVYGCWSVSLRNKDYDTIDKKRMLSV